MDEIGYSGDRSDNNLTEDNESMLERATAESCYPPSSLRLRDKWRKCIIKLPEPKVRDGIKLPPNSSSYCTLWVSGIT